MNNREFVYEPIRKGTTKGGVGGDHMVCKGTVRRSVIAMKRDFRKLPAN